MEINIDKLKLLTKLIDDAKKNENYELEVRFQGKNKIITEDVYKKIFQKLTFSKDNNGFGFQYEMKNILDVILSKTNTDTSSSVRMSINSADEIKKYWLTSDLKDININFIEKEKLDKVDDYNYNIRFSLNNELPVQNILEKNIDLLKSPNYDKLYRFKNRYSIKTDDNLFLIELTSVKTGYGKTFRKSNTLKALATYEIEIEFIGKKTELSNDDILKKLLFYCHIILTNIQNSVILMSQALTQSITDYYAEIANLKNKSDFIAANPVTIHRPNLLRSENIKNIFGGYAVTLKADGQRYFLIVYKPSGKIYIFNNKFDFIDTGYYDMENAGTLIEGEFVQNSEQNDFFMYDILFYKGEDVRRRHLINLQKEFKFPSRLDLIDTFLKSTGRKISELFDATTVVNIKKKQYLYSSRSDGNDIFQKITNIWESRKYSPFNVDGIIFVPITTYYPLRGGSWEYLFKWKPPYLNTIDFLIKINKDDNGNEIKSPYVEIQKRPDKKDETILKQYKTVILYVGGTTTFFNKAFNRPQKKFENVLFNPFKMDETNSNIFNVAKIFIDENERLVARDPITNEEVEISDNTVVEFGYDDTKEDGFKWLPYRFRKDKVSGNYESVANDIFRAIMNPVTEEMIQTGKVPITQDTPLIGNMLSGESDAKTYYAQLSKSTDINNEKRERFPYQNFHNHYIKFQLLYLSSPFYLQKFSTGQHGKILDLCCGKGVDINKIIKAHYAEVVGMDIDLSNVRYAENWYKKMIPMPKPKAFYVRGDSSKLIWPEQATAYTEADKIKTKKYIPTKYYFDSVSVQFCFHYFFENEITCRSIIQNFNDNLKIGGYIVGTCFDGERVYEQLKNVDSISGKTESGEIMWKIDKKFSKTKLAFTDKKPNFGKQIDVFVKTIGNVHPEFLVNFTYLDAIMSAYGFTKVYVKPFEEFYNELITGQNLMGIPQKELDKNIEVAKSMSEEEKRFSFLSTGFMYKKTHNSSDSLIKKLMELIEKAGKLKKDDAVSVVNKDTEHMIQNFEEEDII